MPAAALLAVERVAAHQHPEFEEVVDAAGLLERLVHARVAAGDLEVLLELLVQCRDLRQRLLEAGGGAIHPAVVPDDLAEFTVEVVGAVGAADRHVALEPVAGLRLDRDERLVGGVGDRLVEPARPGSWRWCTAARSTRRTAPASAPRHRGGWRRGRRSWPRRRSTDRGSWSSTRSRPRARPSCSGWPGRCASACRTGSRR